MSTQKQSTEKKKVVVIGRAEGGWTLTDKTTGKQIAFVGENLPLDSYLPTDCEIEKS
jgi:hypothetical protein